MQEILKTDPYYVDKASDAGRLYLVRTKGSLSGGTQVTVVSQANDYSVLKVSGKVQVKERFTNKVIVATEEVLVTLDDLVIRRMSCHPDVLVGGNGTATKQKKTRKVRRKEELASRRVLEQLKAKYSTDNPKREKENDGGHEN